MDSFINQIREAAEEEQEFPAFKERIRKIDEKFIKTFFNHQFDNQAPEHVFRSMNFARPEMTIEQKRMKSPRKTTSNNKPDMTI